MFRRQTISKPWPKVAVIMMLIVIGGRITMHRFSELYLGRCMGVGWVLVGTGVVYMVSREYLRQKRAEKKSEGVRWT